MADLLKEINFEGEIILHEFGAWMDGGSITLSLTDANQIYFEVTICQSVSLKTPVNTDTWIAGSLLFNNIEVPIRSDIERKILAALKSLQFSQNLSLRNSALKRELISSRIAFVESEEYLRIASEMGRI